MREESAKARVDKLLYLLSKLTAADLRFASQTQAREAKCAGAIILVIVDTVFHIPKLTKVPKEPSSPPLPPAPSSLPSATARFTSTPPTLPCPKSSTKSHWTLPSLPLALPSNSIVLLSTLQHSTEMADRYPASSSLQIQPSTSTTRSTLSTMQPLPMPRPHLPALPNQL